jgi:hypothetical protein
VQLLWGEHKKCGVVVLMHGTWLLLGWVLRSQHFAIQASQMGARYSSCADRLSNRTCPLLLATLTEQGI